MTHPASSHRRIGPGPGAVDGNGTPLSGRPRSAAARLLAMAAVLAVLAAVFAAYLDPHTVVDLANRVWACL